MFFIGGKMGSESSGGMDNNVTNKIFLSLLLGYGLAAGQYPGWSHAGTLFILTTPDGADIPATALERDFPVLVRLDKDFFDFAQARPQGEDIRFSTPAGEVLAYQIEEWEPVAGRASIWVRIPAVTGNARQAIRMHWGKSDAAGESRGSAVFNAANGFVSVLHLDDPARDEVGTAAPVNAGTTAAAGMIGRGRHFGGGQGIKGGDALTGYPIGANPHTTQAWVRAEAGNGRVVAWGNEEQQGKLILNVGSPPFIQIDAYFSNANVNGGTRFPLSQWVHMAHTYMPGEARVYLNGRLDGIATGTASPLAIKSPVRMAIGGWYNTYNLVGDVDEVRISKVARSPDWIRMEYENQKPLSTLTGLLVPEGSAFSVSQTQATVLEGKSLRITAQAGGAQKIYWVLKEAGKETVVAVDRLAHEFSAGRVSGNKSVTLQFKAVYPTEIKTRDIAITIQEDMPDPAFTLPVPREWNGRDAISLSPQITNLAEMQAKGAGTLHYSWDIAQIAVIKEIVPGKLTLKRAQNSGKLVVTLAVDNGGSPTVQVMEIAVREPASDPWLARTPSPDEKPENNQFFARGDDNLCTVHYNGTWSQAADSVYLKVYAGNQLHKREAKALPAGGKYAFSPALAPGLFSYRLEFGTKNGSAETLSGTVSNLVCGDAYIVQGQSNAEATQFGADPNPATSEWIRTYGSMGNNPGSGWHTAAHLGTGQVGYWGLEVARRLVTAYDMPICILNGAVGGTRIDQHQRNPANPTDVTTIYGRLLTRIRMARLTHGIRAVLWHQGENDQGSEAPTGRMNWETYQPYFIDLSAAWKEDYPNLRNYYLFQIWPAACGGMTAGSESLLREMQRTLPRFYSNMGIMSTLGIRPGSSCHYSAAGYAEFARLLTPLLERDLYGKKFPVSITPPDVKKAYYTSAARKEIAVEFDQPVVWKPSLASEFYLDGAKGKVASGAMSGNTLTLTLAAASTATKITYLDSRSWSEDNILMGANNIAALTFWNVPIFPEKDYVPVFAIGKRPGTGGEIRATFHAGLLRLDFGSLAGQPVEVRIADLQGRSVWRKNFDSAPTGQARVDAPPLHRGTYVLQVMQAGRTRFQARLASL